MFKSILSATDGSDHGQKATTLASELAAHFNAKLTLVYVIKDAHLSPELRQMGKVEHPLDIQPALAKFFDNNSLLTEDLNKVEDDAIITHRVMRALAERVLQHAKQRASRQGANAIVTVIEAGDPTARIIECAKRYQTDLIVLGSRGMSDLKGLLLGSVSHKVNHLAPCTCITVK